LVDNHACGNIQLFFCYTNITA